MNNKRKSYSFSSTRALSIIDIIAIISVIVSLGSIAWFLWRKLNQPLEWIMIILAIMLSTFVGLFSRQISERLRRFSVSRRIFISYDEGSKSEVEKIANLLHGKGAKVWTADKYLKAGDEIQAVISRAIDECDTFLVILAKRMSKNILIEISMAKGRGKRIIPVLIEGARIPPDLAGIRHIDLRKKKADALKELIQAAL